MPRGFADGGPLDGRFITAEEREITCHAAFDGSVCVVTNPTGDVADLFRGSATVIYRWQWGIWFPDPDPGPAGG